MRYLRVVNWERFQHYKKPYPTWIKLYHRLLDDEDFEDLGELNQCHFMKILMLAAKRNNRIRYDLKWIKRKIGAKSIPNVALLLSRNWLEIIDGIPNQSRGSIDKPLESGRDREETEKSRVRPPPEPPPKPPPSASGSFFDRSPDEIRGLRAILRRLQRKYPKDWPRIEAHFRIYAGINPPWEVAIKALQSLADHDADNPVAYFKKIVRVEEPNFWERKNMAEGEAHKGQRPVSIAEIVQRGMAALRGK
jgi:hypothetical protein